MWLFQSYCVYWMSKKTGDGIDTRFLQDEYSRSIPIAFNQRKYMYPSSKKCRSHWFSLKIILGIDKNTASSLAQCFQVNGAAGVLFVPGIIE